MFRNQTMTHNDHILFYHAINKQTQHTESVSTVI